ncbi:hypothetical protein MPTK1_5g06780 [Marchantia polymorpha subsp. ruderalis]
MACAVAERKGRGRAESLKRESSEQQQHVSRTLFSRRQRKFLFGQHPRQSLRSAAFYRSLSQGQSEKSGVGVSGPRGSSVRCGAVRCNRTEFSNGTFRLARKLYLRGRRRRRLRGVPP